MPLSLKEHEAVMLAREKDAKVLPLTPEEEALVNKHPPHPTLKCCHCDRQIHEFDE